MEISWLLRRMKSCAFTNFRRHRNEARTRCGCQREEWRGPRTSPPLQIGAGYKFNTKAYMAIGLKMK
jgi:hypothetical protein